MNTVSGNQDGNQTVTRSPGRVGLLCGCPRPIVAPRCRHRDVHPSTTIPVALYPTCLQPIRKASQRGPGAPGSCNNTRFRKQTPHGTKTHALLIRTPPPTITTSLSIVKMGGWEENENPAPKPDRASSGRSSHNRHVTCAKNNISLEGQSERHGLTGMGRSFVDILSPSHPVPSHLCTRGQY